MKNNKPAVILAGAIAALFVISVVIRFVALSELGMPGVGCSTSACRSEASAC